MTASFISGGHAARCAERLRLSGVDLVVRIEAAPRSRRGMSLAIRKELIGQASLTAHQAAMPQKDEYDYHRSEALV